MLDHKYEFNDFFSFLNSQYFTVSVVGTREKALDNDELFHQEGEDVQGINEVQRGKPTTS